MKTIIVDLDSDLVYKSALLLAFKVYLHHNALFSLKVVGHKEDFNVISDIQNLTCIETPEGKTSCEVALEELARNKTAGLLSFSSKALLLKKAQEILPKNVTPCYGLLFHSKKNDKESLLVDASGLNARTIENLAGSLSYGRDYLVNVLERGTPAIGLLGLEDVLDPVSLDFDQKMREQDRKYRGIIDPEDLFNGECDLIIAGGSDGAFAIKSSKGARSISKEAEEQQANKSLTSKFNSLLSFGSKKKTVDPAKDPRIDGKGYFLFGFGYNIISLNHDAGYNDFFVAIENIENLDRNKPFHS
jgi:fatty acid/phospholipid biosynthesis enzyme